MDGRVRKGAASSWTPPTRDQPFPFRGLKGVAGFTCSGERPLFYFRFSETPNLIDDEIHDSFNESRTRIKFDEGHPKQITLLQMWGSPSLRVNTYRNVNLGGWNHTPDPKWLQEVSTSSEMLIELPWYSRGKVYFRFDLHGAESALREAVRWSHIIGQFGSAVKVYSVV